MNFFKNIYDPSEADIQKIFPDYKEKTREEYIDIFKNETSISASEYAAFALNKLELVTTSYKLTDNQKNQLESLKKNSEVNGLTGMEAYCSILTPRQIGYVGI